MKRPAILGLALLLVLFIATGVWFVRGDPGPVLYVGGPIITADAENRVFDALATVGDRIESVGDAASLRAWAEESGARVVELDGRAVVPGFIDAHGHFPGAGLGAFAVDLNSPPIGDVSNISELVLRLATRAEDTAPGEWLVAFGYDDTLLQERRHPTRRDLDEASLEHPIAVLHISGHLAVANSAGLEKLGIAAATDDPEGGVIRREAGTREPDGVLEETAMEPLQALLVPGLLDSWRVLQSANAKYLGQGVTTAQSGHTDAGLVAALVWMSRLGFVPTRLVVWPDLNAANGMLESEDSRDTADPLSARIGAVKLVADGSIQGYTGYLSEPYHVPPGDDPTYRGYPRIPRDDLIRDVARFHNAGWQVAVHGNGDASIDDILDAFEAAQRANPRDDARHIIIHAQMARDDQLDRMAELGVIPSFFSLHTFYWGDRHREIFMGPARAERMSPARSARERDVRFTIHADAPVVPMEPLRLMWSAVNRRTRSGDIIGAAQRLSPMEALRAVTIDAAWQHFEEADKGSLEPGKLADLVVLSRSPLEEPGTIDRIEVVETVIGGRSLYKKDD